MSLTVRNWTHVNGLFSTAAGQGAANTLVVTPGSGAGNAGVEQDGGRSVLRLRLPGLDPATVAASGADRRVRVVATFSTARTGVTLAATRFDPDAGAAGETLLAETTMSRVLPATANAATNAANQDRTHHADVDVASLAAAEHAIVDLEIGHIPTYRDVRLLPLHYPGIPGNAGGKVRFD